MDIPCPRCGEPWDNDSLHDLVEDDEFQTYQDAYAAYRRKGCVVLTGKECRRDNLAASRSDLADLFGDDTDGYASFMDDLAGIL